MIAGPCLYEPDDGSGLLVCFVEPDTGPDWWGWAIRRDVALGLDLAQEMLDCDIELRVSAVGHLGWVSDDLDVRINPVPFDAPGAIEFVEPEVGDGDIAAIDE